MFPIRGKKTTKSDNCCDGYDCYGYDLLLRGLCNSPNCPDQGHRRRGSGSDQRVSSTACTLSVQVQPKSSTSPGSLLDPVPEWGHHESLASLVPEPTLALNTTDHFPERTQWAVSAQPNQTLGVAAL
uniref:(northern house mosquito) hypothetical protein n=1 Tax=Culex pipiens TaxID=7175 RepID=A0A8D8HTL6_CULPI